MRLATTLTAALAVVPPLLAAEPGPPPAINSPVREIIVVCKTHFDIGYTHRVNEIVHYYRTEMIDRAMDIMDAGRDLPPEQQFAWTGPGWVMSKVLEDWDGQTPERRKRLDENLKAGRFQFHALPFTLESDACEPEEMARGFIFASDLCRRNGMPLPRSGKMTDVPSHGGALATVLAQGGVQFMHIGCNWPSGCVDTPGLFWWEGPDGSRVLTFYSNTYGTCVPPFLPRWYSDRDPFISSSLVPPADWPHPVWPAIIVTPDNTGPPKAAQIEALFEDAKERLPGVTIRMGTMDDFAEALLKADPELPVIRGEMPDTWIHGIMSDPGGIRLSREVRPLLAAAETLHTQLGLWGVTQPPIADQVTLAYEKTLLYGEHTWGGAASVRQYGDAFQKLDPANYARLEASWEDKTDYIRDATRITRGIMETNLQSLADAVKHDAPCMVVYNPLPWTRSGYVAMNGETVFVKDVPPSGYRTQPLPPRSMRLAPRRTSEPATIENAFFKLTLDPARGAITSLVDKRTGREWLDPAEPLGLGRYLNERFTFEQTLDYTVAYQGGRAFKSFGAKGEWPHPGMHKPGMISEKEVPCRAASSANGIALIDANSATLECPADPAHHLPGTILRITLPLDQPCIDLELTIKDKPKDNWPEADWLCLPFKIHEPQFRVHRQLGVMNPATDILRGANRHLYAVGHGITIADADGSGIAICPLDHPLISLGQPGCWKFSNDFVPRKPVVFLNLYNNQWNTNFRYWYPGTWSSRVRLWTFDRNTQADAMLAKGAAEARNPLLAVRAEGKGGPLPATQTGLTLSRPGVLVTAFGENPDGPGTLLRVWDQSGQGGRITATLPARFTSAKPVNLRGEANGAPVPITEDEIAFALPAFAPASYLLH